MKSVVIVLLVLFTLFFPGQSNARAVPYRDMKELIAKSRLVFVGEIKSVEPSGLTAKETLPLSGKITSCGWLKVEAQVIAAVKGTTDKTIVRVLVLFVKAELIANGPGVIDPKIGQRYLFCLLPTGVKNVYASIGAPMDDNQGIVLLDRKSWAQATYYKNGNKVPFQQQNDKNADLWQLVGDDGEINPKGVEKLRGNYQAEITAAADTVIHLESDRPESQSQWNWDAPGPSQ